PDTTLTALAATVPGIQALPSLRASHSEAETLLHTAATLHVNGQPIDWTPALSSPAPQPVDLPTYPFQHQHYWLQASQPVPTVASAGIAALPHPLLGAAVDLPDTAGLILTGRLSTHQQPWLTAHTINTTTLLPGTAFIELALQAATHTHHTTLEELTLEV